MIFEEARQMAALWLAVKPSSGFGERNAAGCDILKTVGIEAATS
jgi:hypothetical protein